MTRSARIIQGPPRAFGLDRVFELLVPRGAGQVYSPVSTQLTGPGRARAADGRSDS
jgi:hypothetical protein